MEFIDRTGHIFSLPSYDTYPTGYEYETFDYIFYLEDEYVRRLSVNNYYIKPVRVLLHKGRGAVDALSIKVDSSVFRLIGSKAIQEKTKTGTFNIEFDEDDDAFKSELTLNDISIIEDDVYRLVTFYIIGCASSAATWTPSTNYGTYNNNAITNVNGDDNTYFWSNEAQSVGKYILFTFNKFIDLTGVTTYSSNSTDYPRSVNKLQVSSDNTNWVNVGTFQDNPTSTFTGINATKIKYVRIYCDTTGNNSWLVLNSVTFTYTVPVIEEGYSYTLSNIDGDKTVEVTFINTNRILIKVNGEYKEGTAYKKTSGRWTAVTPKELSDYLKDKKIKKKI